MNIFQVLCTTLLLPLNVNVISACSPLCSKPRNLSQLRSVRPKQRTVNSNFCSCKPRDTPAARLGLTVKFNISYHIEGKRERRVRNRGVGFVFMVLSHPWIIGVIVSRLSDFQLMWIDFLHPNPSLQRHNEQQCQCKLEALLP